MNHPVLNQLKKSESAMKAEYCRGCYSKDLFTVHDFGNQPLAGYYPTEPETTRPAEKYPLGLAQCKDCALLQVLNVPPIEEIFHNDYRYSSSTVPGLRNHFSSYADWLQIHVGKGKKVFEFGCNDGVLLERLRNIGISCSGIDASDNVADLARAKGLQVATGFLDEDYVRNASLVECYDLVTCSNVLAHIHQVQDTLRAVRLLLKSGGLFAIEVHNGEYLSSQNQFDTIYHEHLTYFTEATLRSLLERNGFNFVLCERTAMHGGGLRCLAKKSTRRETSSARKRAEELAVSSQDFVGPVIERCQEQLEQLYETYGPLVGYGAAGRSQMFINFSESARLFSRIYDDSPFRQGRYIAGTDIPIVRFEGASSDCVIVLAWNYADDIFRRVGSRFNQVVTLLPEFRIW